MSRSLFYVTWHGTIRHVPRTRQFAMLKPAASAGQGSTVQEARANLEEAVGLFFETAADRELLRRLSTEVYVTRVEVPVPSRKPNRR